MRPAVRAIAPSYTSAAPSDATAATAIEAAPPDLACMAARVRGDGPPLHRADDRLCAHEPQPTEERKDGDSLRARDPLRVLLRDARSLRAHAGHRRQRRPDAALAREEHRRDRAPGDRRHRRGAPRRRRLPPRCRRETAARRAAPRASVRRRRCDRRDIHGRRRVLHPRWRSTRSPSRPGARGRAHRGPARARVRAPRRACSGRGRTGRRAPRSAE